MILPMSRVRLIGPRDRLQATLDTLQDFGRMQLDRIPLADGLAPASRERRADRLARALRRMRDDAGAALVALGRPARSETATIVGAPDLPRWARAARRHRRAAEGLRGARQALEDERNLLGRYEDFLNAFSVLLASLADAQHLRVYGVTLPGHERARVDTLADALRHELGAEVVVLNRTLPTGDVAVLIAVPASAQARMERALSGARIAEVPLPSGYADESLTAAAPRILERLASIPALLAENERRVADMAAHVEPELRAIQATVNDRLTADAAGAMSSTTRHAFAVEGWVPRADVATLKQVVDQRLGGDIVFEELGQEEWKASEAPVVLTNPRLFRPFEVLTGILPLPAYGSIDPTPFLAVGFPMLFGMILGDAGYGFVLAVTAGLLIRGADVGSFRRSAGEMALACSAFAIVFGLLFGELFGTLGHEWFGLEPVLIDREKSIVSAIVAAVGVGVVHTAVGLVLGMIKSRHEPRLAASRAVQLGMLTLIVLAGLSAVKVLPNALFGPLAIAVLVGFPVLLALEGIVAPIEFFSTLSSILSYVRIMALGTASVLLASVANRMTGMFGSVLVGVLFGLLFHLVNFAMGVFSPTVHALRLHYVEFFKHFYSPGGRPYEPFRHSGPPGTATPRG
jgi:V/A-type H+-transporting ATPase subunit I